MHMNTCGNMGVCLSVHYLYTHIDIYLNLEIQNGLCRTQELTERWELPVCDSPVTVCWEGFNFAEVTRKGCEGILENTVSGL